MKKKVPQLLVLVHLFSVTAFAQPCEITGTVPAKIRANICDVVTGAHGGGEPVNQLTVSLKRAPAAAFWAKTPEARDFMLTLLNTWMTGRNVRVARVEAYFGRARIAVAETRAWDQPRVTFD